MFEKQPPTVPAAWVAHIASVVAPFNVSRERLLEGQAITVRELADPGVRVSVETLVELIERARTLTREPGIGVHLGLQTRATLWGNLGFATLAAPSMGTALELAVRYCDVVTSAIGLRLRADRSTAELIVDERVDFGSARDVLVFWLLLGIWKVGSMMTGSESTARVELAIDEPAYLPRLRAGLPSIRCQRPANRLIFSSARLDQPYLLHDPAALCTAVELCERQHEALGNSIVPRVRGMLTRSSILPGFKTIAARLRLSPRTLSRRLSDEGASFRELLEEERKRQGITLVCSDERSLAQVAARLGYSNVSNFERAFRRWTGCSPAQYRRTSSSRDQRAR